MERLFELRRTTANAPHFRRIEFLEVEAKSIINRVPGHLLPFRYTINPYRGCTHACVYCFARVTHTYLDMDAGRDFETKIVVKVNAVELLRRELRSPRWPGELIAMGTATDPYQRAEGRYGLTRGIVRTLVDFGNPFSILTKGTLILRDLDILRVAAQRGLVSAALSIPTLDEVVWRRSEPGTPHPRKRMEAVRRLNEAGVPTGVMVAPILPGLCDRPEQLEAVVRAAAAAGATWVTPILLHLRPVVRQEFEAWLRSTYPDLVSRYEALYGGGAYVPRPLRSELAERVAALARAAGVGKDGRHRPAGAGAPAHRTRGRPRVPARAGQVPSACLVGQQLPLL